MRRPLLPHLRLNMYFTISCPDLPTSSTRARRDRIIALAGDFNACVGSHYTSWSGMLGAHGVGNLNKNGLHLLGLYSAFKLYLVDIHFAGSTSSKVTWMHPRFRRWHQLDHMIVRRQLNKVSHCRSMHFADRNTDHALVRCKLALQARIFNLSHSRPSPPSTTLQSNTL